MTGPHSSVMDIMAWLRQYAPASLQRDLQADSRRVGAGDVFIALPGVAVARAAGGSDGRDFIGAAVALGAAAVIAEADGWVARDVGVPLLPVRGLRLLLGQLAARFYGNPSERLLSIGVTGTNGKTSCTHWIAQSLAGSARCAVIGTVGSGFADSVLAHSPLTTPDAIGLQRELARLEAEGARAVAMEVSSIGLDQGRVNGMKFDIALFTNLTRDHLDYHGSMAAYEAAKTILFDWPTLTHAVVNLDDPAGRRLAERLRDRARGGTVRVIGTSLASERDDAFNGVLAARLTAHSIRATASGLAFEVKLERTDHDPAVMPVEVELVGLFNVANLLGVFGVLLACGVSLEQATAAAPSLVVPAGRMQRVTAPGAPLAVIDYAHTPDALEKALAALRPMVQARGGRLWVVFGAGGDRDAGKRAPMGEAAAAADCIVITSDNPRGEDPAAIVEAIAAGVPAARFAAQECERVIDRAQAIARTLRAARAADVVLIAGKGHEAYQEAGGQRLPFSDVVHARAAIAQRSHA